MDAVPAVATEPSVPGEPLVGAASVALAGLLHGPHRPAVVLGANRRAAWCAVDSDVVVISDPTAVRLPNGVVVPVVPPLEEGAVLVGGGAIAGRGWRIVVGRWWEPRPALPTTEVAVVRRGLADAGPAAGMGVLAAALRRGEQALLLAAARRLIGRGFGLTPEGDDVLAGAVAAFLLVGEALDASGGVGFPSSTETALVELALSATTALSAALLRHALRGEVCLPVAGLLRALAAGGGVAEARLAVEAVGHGSGRALLAGVRLGAAAACEAAA